jgi:acyl-CoA synthetase (AMP-forming)/AMP-acid ligase II
VHEEGPLLQRMLHYEQCRPDWVFCSFIDHQAKVTDALTVATFLTHVRSAAAWLMRQGVRRGDRVVLSLPTSRTFVVGYFAVQWLGAIPVPGPEPSLLFKRQAYCDRMVGVIADCSPAACIVLPAAIREFDTDDAPADWRALRDLLLPWENDGAMTPISGVPSASSPDDLAFLQYTSGSTGSPKGVAVTHRALRAEIKNARIHRARTELRTGDLGYLCQGSLYIVGRLKDVMQIGGANYYPADIESVLQDIPGVRPGRIVAVAIRKPSIGTDSLVIVAEPRVHANEPLLRDQIQEKVRQHIGLSVGKIVFLAKGRLPLTTSGKVMRTKCAELLVGAEFS